MPAVKRWAFNHLRWGKNIFCLVSLLIFMGTVGTLGASYVFRLEVNFFSEWGDTSAWHRRVHTTGCCWGVLFIERLDRTSYGNAEWESEVRFRKDRAAPLPNRGFIGFYGGRTDSITPWGKDVLVTLWLPLWLFLPFGIPPMLWWRKRRTNRGRGQGGFPVEAASQTPAELKS